MRVFAVLGSPRKNGATAHLLDWVTQSLAEQGHTIDFAHIADYTIAGCTECYACKKAAFEGCSIRDGAIELLERMVQADAILFAAPLFCWGFPAPMKALVDRMFCLVEDFRSNPDYDSRIKDKTMGLIVTAGGPMENNADLLITAFRNLTAFTRARLGGVLCIPFCQGVESLGEEEKARARELAAQLAGNAPRGAA